MLDWGKRMMVMGGLRELNPSDLSAALRPGVQRDLETRIGMPALTTRIALTSATSLEAFYQLAFEPA